MMINFVIYSFITTLMLSSLCSYLLTSLSPYFIKGSTLTLSPHIYCFCHFVALMDSSKVLMYWMISTLSTSVCHSLLGVILSCSFSIKYD